MPLGGSMKLIHPTLARSLLRQYLPSLERAHNPRLLDAGIEYFLVHGLLRQLVELDQLAVEAVDFRYFQHVARQTQPDQQTFHARAWSGQVFGLLLVAQQLQGGGFLAQLTLQPLGQFGGTLAVTALVAFDGPAALPQPERSLQGEQAPARLIQLGGKLVGCALADILVGLAGFDARSPVIDQAVKQLAQFAAAGARCGLAEAAEQGAQFDQVLQPLFKQLPVALETILFGQALAVAQQQPGQRGESIVQLHVRFELWGRQLQGITVGIVQAVATL